MEFVETPIFTKQILKLLSEESYREFQNEVFQNPEIGKLIKGGCGIRKVRWSLPNKGKSGGIRIIYFFKNTKNLVYLLFAYPKNVADNLTDEQVAQLAKLVKEL
mgnify:CR=1 FL=1|jgi:hypothetical protein